MIFRLIVCGRVQGVNFRNMTRQFCLREGIKGTIQNLENGEVEIFAQCSRPDKEKLILWLRSSPGFSRVGSVEVEKINGDQQFKGFEILREGNFLMDQGRSAKNLGKEILKL